MRYINLRLTYLHRPKNNLQLNRAKSVETVITDSRWKTLYSAPLILRDISRVTSTKVLGVNIISDVICRCAQSLYAIKVLRCHGMIEEELRLVFKTVVLAKILYATPAWWGFTFTSAAGRQRIEAFVRRCVRLGLYRASDPTLTQFIADNDDNLFRKMLYNEHHILNNFFLTSQIISIVVVVRSKAINHLHLAGRWSWWVPSGCQVYSHLSWEHVWHMTSALTLS